MSAFDRQVIQKMTPLRILHTHNYVEEHSEHFFFATKYNYIQCDMYRTKRSQSDLVLEPSSEYEDIPHALTTTHLVVKAHSSSCIMDMLTTT